MSRIAAIVFFLSGCFLATGQTLHIYDLESRNALSQVSIISQSPPIVAITNDLGEADVSEFRGLQQIEIRTLGYVPVLVSYFQLEEASFQLYLEPSQLRLDEVVVSATRWRQSSGRQPSKIATISAREVALQNPQTAADLLGVSGKVFIQKSQQGGGSPMIRGFATNRLLYSVDGVRMNNAIFRGGNLQNVISLDPFAMEKTEVLFGPGSVIYGSDAIGGVMSFQTIEPRLSESEKTLINGKAIARYSSANSEQTAHFDVSAGWKKWALVSSFSSWDYDHLRQGTNGPDEYLKPYFVQRQNETDQVITQSDPLLQIPSGYSQINFMQKVRFQPSESWDFQYGLHFSETSPYGRYDRHNRKRNGTARYAEWDYGPQKWWMNNLSVSYNSNWNLFDKASLRLAHQQFDESRTERILNDPVRNGTEEAVNAWSANLDFIKSVSDRNTLFYGFEYVLNDVNSTGRVEDVLSGESMPGPARYPMADWQSAAFYVNEQLDLSPRFRIQVGARYNHYRLNAEFDTSFYPFPFTTSNLNRGALTGSIGAVYRPAEDLVWNLNLGTAFRAPNVDDIGKVFDSEPGRVTVPNPDLNAEYAYNADIGIARVFGQWLKVDLSAYYTILDNALVRRNFQLNGEDSILYQGVTSRVQALQNAARANVYGIQAGLELKLPSGFGFSTDLNFQKGEEELDDGSKSSSRHAAPFFGVTRLHLRAERLNLSLYTVYQGAISHDNLAVSEQSKAEIYAKDAEGNTYAPSWYTLNMKALYRLNDMFSVSAGLENITDQRYRPYSSGISGAGRNLVFSLTARF